MIHTAAHSDATRQPLTAWRSGVVRLLAILLVLSFVSTSLARADYPPRGAKGYGLSVFQGTEPERFEVEFLGYVEGFGSTGAMLLAKVSGSVVDRTGVQQGMSGSPVYVRCTFDSNVANLGAGALLRSAGGDYMQLSDCLFVGNQSAGYGGALAKLDAGRLEVQRTSFVGNVSGTDGGAVSIWEDGFFHECIFNANSAANGTILKRGGGIADVFGSTLVNNQGGALVNAGGLVVLRNSISWNNSPFEIGAGVGVTYSNVLGGAAGIGNIDADPRFRDALGQDGIPGTLDDDLTLLKNSPCIDAGDTLELHKGPVWANPIPYPVDFAGAPRAVDHPGRPDTGVPSLGLTVDMGAFEFQPATRNCNQVVNPTTYP